MEFFLNFNIYKFNAQTVIFIIKIKKALSTYTDILIN